MRHHQTRDILLLLLLAILASCTGKTTVSVASFGAVPDDGKNDAAALRQAAEYCRAHPGTILFFPPGIYDLEDEEAVLIERNAIDGTYGRGLEVQRRLFKDSHPDSYVTGMDFTGAKDLSILAHGATLRVDGWMQVLSFEQARNIHLEGLSITTHRPAATEALVTKVQDSVIDMEYDPLVYTYIDSIAQGRTYFYRPDLQHFIYGGGKMDLVERGHIRMESKDDIHEGDVCIIRYGGHYRPCIMVKESQGVTLKDVSIRSYSGMGVVGHMSKDILIDGLKVIPEPGHFSSTTTDATHFTSCWGDLTIQNSIFAGNGDDCTNIHNYYYHIYPQKGDGKSVEIRIEGADLHAQSLDYPFKGDTMIIVGSQDMALQGKYAVRDVSRSLEDWKVVITLDRPVSLDHPEDYLMTNDSRSPKVQILSNTIQYHNGRGFLLKAKDVTVRGNAIKGCTHTAIKLGAELSWMEAGPVHHALIEENYIKDCGSLGSDEMAVAVMVTTECPKTPDYVNRNITIRYNVIDTEKPLLYLLQDARNVRIEHNIAHQTDGLQTENCKDVEMIP